MKITHVQWDSNCDETNTFEGLVNEALEELEKEHVIHDVKFSEHSHRICDSDPKNAETVWGYSAYILYRSR